VQVNAASYSDLAGNEGSASNTVDFTGNTLAPTVSVAANSTTLLAGDTPQVTFTFSEAVTSFVLGDTTVTGGTLGNLIHVGLNGSGQDIYTATFTPDVTHTESGSVEVNAASYTDVAGNIGSASNTLDFTGNTLAPAETSLTATTDNGQSDIGINHTVTITLDTSEPVTVTGTPTLTLNNGGTAHYDPSGSTSDVLAFTYVVAQGDTTPDLQVTGYSGTIQDAAGNSLAPVSGDLALKIDGDVPATPTVALTTDTGISSADNITSDPTLKFSAATPGDTLLYKVDSGGFSATVPNFAADPNFATDHTADGVHTVSVEQQDPLGNLSAVASLTFTLDTTPPILSGITASPASGSIFAGSTETFTFAFNEAVDVTGGKLSLTLNDGGTAVYDATATAALHDQTKLAFDYLVSSNDPPTPSLAITGYNANGATVADLTGNLANLSNVAATFNTMVNENAVPAYTVGGFTRPALELDSTGHIILDAAASAAAATYGLKFLYLGLPESTPYPPVADTHLTDFHLIV
jgi:Bacterial Ig-like domain